MTKAEYMTTLSRNLRRLPKEDYEKAISYFEEYFAEAGVENEQQAIEDLGTPGDAARELIMNLTVKNAQEPPKTVKHGLSAVWIGILGICAAPIALPLAFSLVVVIFCFLLVAFLFIFCLFLTAVCLAAGGILAFVSGIILLFTSTADGLTVLGTGLFVSGLGTLTVYASVILCRCFLRKTSKTLADITKRGKTNEKDN